MSSEVDLPAAMPTVIFDTGLRDHVSDIDFDYHAFYDLASTNGLSDDAINGFTLHYSAKDSRRNAGRYYVTKDLVRVFVPTLLDSNPRIDALDQNLKTEEESAQLSLATRLSRVSVHEAAHRFRRNREAPIMVGRNTLLYMTYASAPGMAELAVSESQHPTIGKTLLLGAWAVAMLAQNSFGDPKRKFIERGAYAFQNEYSDLMLVACTPLDRLDQATLEAPSLV